MDIDGSDHGLPPLGAAENPEVIDSSSSPEVLLISSDSSAEDKVADEDPVVVSPDPSPVEDKLVPIQRNGVPMTRIIVDEYTPHATKPMHPGFLNTLLAPETRVFTNGKAAAFVSRVGRKGKNIYQIDFITKSEYRQLGHAQTVVTSALQWIAKTKSAGETCATGQVVSDHATKVLRTCCKKLGLSFNIFGTQYTVFVPDDSSPNSESESEATTAKKPTTITAKPNKPKKRKRTFLTLGRTGPKKQSKRAKGPAKPATKPPARGNTETDGSSNDGDSEEDASDDEPPAVDLQIPVFNKVGKKKATVKLQVVGSGDPTNVTIQNDGSRKITQIQYNQVRDLAVIPDNADETRWKRVFIGGNGYKCLFHCVRKFFERKTKKYDGWPSDLNVPHTDGIWANCIKKLCIDFIAQCRRERDRETDNYIKAEWAQEIDALQSTNKGLGVITMKLLQGVFRVQFVCYALYTVDSEIISSGDDTVCVVAVDDKGNRVKVRRINNPADCEEHREYDECHVFNLMFGNPFNAGKRVKANDWYPLPDHFDLLVPPTSMQTSSDDDDTAAGAASPAETSNPSEIWFLAATVLADAAVYTLVKNLKTGDNSTKGKAKQEKVKVAFKVHKHVNNATIMDIVDTLRPTTKDGSEDDDTNSVDTWLEIIRLHYEETADLPNLFA